MMDSDGNSGVSDRPQGLTDSENLRMRIADSLGSCLVRIGFWLLFGFILVVSLGIWPRTTPTWLVVIVIASALLILEEGLAKLFFRVFGTPFKRLPEIPPFSWLARWLRCEDSEGDRLLRFAGLAVGLLAAFLLALKIFFPD